MALRLSKNFDVLVGSVARLSTTTVRQDIPNDVAMKKFRSHILPNQEVSKYVKSFLGLDQFIDFKIYFAFVLANARSLWRPSHCNCFAW